MWMQVRTCGVDIDVNLGADVDKVVNVGTDVDKGVNVGADVDKGVNVGADVDKGVSVRADEGQIHASALTVTPNTTTGPTSTSSF